MMATQRSVVIAVVMLSKLRTLKLPIAKPKRSAGALSGSNVPLSCPTWRQSTAQCPSWWHLGHVSLGLQKLGQAFTKWLFWPHLQQEPGGLWAWKDKESMTIAWAYHRAYANIWYFCLISSLSLWWYTLRARDKTFVCGVRGPLSRFLSWGCSGKRNRSSEVANLLGFQNPD